jgi:hypothetical protein
MNKVLAESNLDASVGQEPSDVHVRARYACQDLIFRSFKLIDAGRASETRKLFIEEGVHTLNGELFQGKALTEFFNAREANVARRTRHCVANISFELLTEHGAQVSYTSVVYVLPQQTPGAVCDIRDTFVKRDHPEGWKFTRRDVMVVAGNR